MIDGASGPEIYVLNNVTHTHVYNVHIFWVLNVLNTVLLSIVHAQTAATVHGWMSLFVEGTNIIDNENAVSPTLLL